MDEHTIGTIIGLCSLGICYAFTAMSVAKMQEDKNPWWGFGGMVFGVFGTLSAVAGFVGNIAGG